MISKYKDFNWQVNEVKLKYEPKALNVPLDCSSTINSVLHEIWEEDLLSLQEQFYGIFLNSKFEPLCWKLLGTGNMVSTPCNIKLLCSIAVKTMCRYVIVGHNHPSGVTKPSKADKNFTDNLADLMQYFEIDLLDHVIITPDKKEYYSFADSKFLYKRERIFGLV